MIVRAEMAAQLRSTAMARSARPWRNSWDKTMASSVRLMLWTAALRLKSSLGHESGADAPRAAGCSVAQRQAAWRHCDESIEIFGRVKQRFIGEGIQVRVSSLCEFKTRTEVYKLKPIHFKLYITQMVESCKLSADCSR